MLEHLNDILENTQITASTAAVRLAISFVLGAIIGVERQFRRRDAGMRTFTLICMGSAAAMLISIWIPQTYPNFLNGDPGRIAAQVLTGIGFLGAGAIIHAVHSNEMSQMGGLRKYMPITHITFLIACLAIAGIPPFSGFFSKDEILAAAFEKSAFWGVWMSLVAGLTAFYMFRLYFNIFWGKEAHHEHTPHEAPKTMSIPLVFLAVVTCFAGFIPFGHFVTASGLSYTIHLNWAVAGTSICIAIIGIALATWLYMKPNDKPARMAESMSSLHRWAYHRFYIDEVYMFITHKIIFRHICMPIAWFDRHVVDGTMNLMATITQSASYHIRGLQSGRLQSYAVVFLLGAMIVAAVVLCCL